MSNDDLTDAQLIARVLRGDQERYADLVRRYQEMLYRHAFGMVRDSDVAADLVQDSFVKAYTSLAACTDPARFAAWLFRILRNRCKDYLKSRRRRDVSLDDEMEFALEHGDPEHDLDRIEIRGAVERALAALPEAHREAFLLKHVEGLSYEEMSEMLEVGVSALKMRVKRARESLQVVLEELGNPVASAM